MFKFVSTDLGCSQVRSEKCLALDSRQWGDTQLYEEMKIRDVVPNSKLNICSKYPNHWGIGSIAGQKKERNRRAGGWEGMLWKSSEHDYQTNETTAAVVTCTRPAQDQANRYPGIDGAGEFQAPCLTQKQSTASGKVRYFFFLRVWSLVSVQSCSRRFHSHCHMLGEKCRIS